MNPRLAFLALLVIGTGACAAKSPTIESTHAGSFQAKSIGFMPSGGDPKDISSNLEFAFPVPITAWCPRMRPSNSSPN